MQLQERTFSSGNYRYGFNGQEKSVEINENSFTAEYWEYDSRIGRRWNEDPKPNASVSNYACFYNNPVSFVDFKGDSSVWDNKGYMIHYDPNDKDLRAFMKDGDKLTLIGELGKTIDASQWFKNLLKENSVIADDISSLNPEEFKERVQKDGPWDYKYASPANPNFFGRQHIIGIAFYRKDKSGGLGDLGETMFSFEGNFGRAEDLNNFHYGVVGKAYGGFVSEELLLRKAGEAEMGKWKDEGKEVPASWRPVQVTPVVYHHKHGTKRGGETVLLPPYGDNPVDHEWIKKGFTYYKKNRSDLDGDWW